MRGHPPRRARPVIVSFNYSDLFEDFFPLYGIDQAAFPRFAGTANHTFLALLQRDVGDVVWYLFTLASRPWEVRHETVGCLIRFLPVPWPRRLLRRVVLRVRALRSRGRISRRQDAPGPVPAGRPRIYRTLGYYLTMLSLPFIRALARDRPDFLFVQDYSTGRYDLLVLAARLLGIPLVARHAGSRPETYLAPWTKRWTIPAAHRIIVGGGREREVLMQRFAVAPERIAVIPTPIDTELFRPIDRPAACARAGLDPQRRYLLFVGRLDDRPKQVGLLIRAFARLAAAHLDADLLVVGEGPDGPHLRHLAAESAPGRIRFLGWIGERGALVPLYNAAECLVLSSRHEGLPAVVAEALSCGTPVLAARVGEVGEFVVDGETGWLVVPGDEAALVAGLSMVLAHPQEVRALRPRVRANAEARLAPSATAAALRAVFTRPAAPAGLSRQSA